MRAAKQEKLYVVVDDFLLEINKIDFIAAIFIDQRRIYELATIAFNGQGKWIIYWPLNQDTVAFGGEAADCGCNGKDYPRGTNEPFVFYFPVEGFLQPTGKRGKIIRFDIGIAKDSMLACCSSKLLLDCSKDFDKFVIL